MNKSLSGDIAANVVKAVQAYYFAETPPPKFVTVDQKTLRQYRNDPNSFCAKVTIESEHVPGKVKKHTVHIRFRLDHKKHIQGSVQHL